MQAHIVWYESNLNLTKFIGFCISILPGCATAEFPGFSAEVATEIEWIKEQVCTHAANPPDWACAGGTSPVEATRPSSARSESVWRDSHWQ